MPICRPARPRLHGTTARSRHDPRGQRHPRPQWTDSVCPAATSAWASESAWASAWALGAGGGPGLGGAAESALFQGSDSAGEWELAWESASARVTVSASELYPE